MDNNRMTIIEHFNPHNILHIKAYDHLRKTGMWPEEIFSFRGLSRPIGWQIALTSKLADAYVDQMLKAKGE